ncbi:aldehyde dehydrogenase family protein [Paraburkholderia sp. RL17-347-BIC-D]|uniref:aldehyde dehydrogenase family protein n=1 Tax=Paraburkholderia sp. RL17-347-BIC-D TaxID=3031632 RepID=UPI0038B8A39A
MNTQMVNAAESRNVNWVLDLLINGEMVKGEGAPLPVENPATEEILASPREASMAQLEKAVTAARRAFNSGIWRDAEERQRLLCRLADLLEERADQFCAALIEEVGTPLSICHAMQLGTPIKMLRFNANAATKDRTRSLGRDAGPPATESLIRYEPVGVVAAISAYNFPILIAVGKIAAALSAGCTVVLMPSPQTPLATLMLADLIREAGFPPGVVNVIIGGLEISRALTMHKDVDKISFTGSVQVGRQVALQAADSFKGTVLELGGKSAAIVLPGADLAKIALPIHGRYLRNAGQGCLSPTRVLVQKKQLDDFIDASREAYAKIQVGDPWDPATTAGPLITEKHRERVEGYVARAVSSGAKIEIGGGRPEMERGWYMNSTLVGNVTNQAEIAREELFGPVGVIMTYDTVSEAIAMANDSDLGLGGAIWGPLDEAKEVAEKIRAGTVSINGTGTLRIDGVLSGWKHSGLGREWGEDGIQEFLETQHVQWVLD